MKLKNCKLNKLILAVSGLLFLSSPALADDKPYCDISSAPFLTYDCYMSNQGTTDYLSYDNIQLGNNSVFRTDFRDKNLVLTRTDGGNEGTLFFKVIVDPDAVSSNPEITYELRKFKSITHTTTGAGNDANGAYFAVANEAGKKATTSTKVSFERGNATESLIKASAQDANASGINADYGTSGFQKFKLANPNLKVEANAQGGSSYGVLETLADTKDDNYSNLNSEIIAAKINSTSNREAIGVAVRSESSVAKATLNNTVDRSTLIVTGTDTAVGLTTIHGDNAEGTVSTALSTSTLHVSGAASNTGLMANASNNHNFDSNTATASQSNGSVIYIGGDLDTTDPTGPHWTANDSVTAQNTGLLAIASNTALAKAEQDDGQLFVSGSGNSKVPGGLSAGLYAHGGSAWVEQFKETDRIVVSGNNTAAIIAQADTEGSTVRVKGTLEAKDFGIYSVTPGGQSSNITIQSGAKIYADVAIYNDDGDSNIDFIDNITLGKADQKTKISLGGGTDSLDMHNINLDNVTELDGGADEDSLNLSGYQNLALGAKFKNWEGIKLEHGTYILEDDLKVATNPGIPSEEKGLYLRSNVTLLTTSPEATLDGDLYSEGATIDLTQNADDQGRKLTVNNYTSFRNKLYLNLGDLLTINGKVTGSETEVYLTKGAKTVKPDADGIKIVAVSDTSSVETKKFAFNLQDSLAAGAYEYNKIEFSDVSGKRGFYLKSKPLATSATIGPKSHLLRQEVVGYALAQQIQGQALTTVNGDYYSRLGAVSVEDFNNPAWRSWARLLVNKNYLEAENLKANTYENGIQSGWDFQSFANNRTGFSATYQKVETNLGDTFRSNHNIPGKFESDLGALNFYHTLRVNNAYFDVNAGLHFIHNDYQIKDGSQENAYGTSLALEAGNKFTFGSIFVEPQLQLAYQFTNYQSFSDRISTVESYKYNSLVPSLGMRLGYQAGGNALWLNTQVAQELLKTTAIVVSGDAVATSRASKTTYKVSLNGQVALSSYAKLYAKVGYQANHNKLTTYHKVGGQVGVRFTWR